jgi:hypothetical protein
MEIQSVPSLVKKYWQQGFFKKERLFIAIQQRLSSDGENPEHTNLSHALSRAKFLTRRGKAGKYRFIQKSSYHGKYIGEDIFPEDLRKIIEKDFHTEIEDIENNYGISGTCTAFLLRKVLEKLIYLSFAKNGQEHLLQDGKKNLVGLGTMLNLAETNKSHGKPYLLHKTAQLIQGIKFLGDTAAHNPIANVSMKTIEPSIPYIITAYKELANKLK